MTTSCLKPATSTSQHLTRNTAPAISRELNRKPQVPAARGRSTAAQRFLSVLMNSLSAWAV